MKGLKVKGEGLKVKGQRSKVKGQRWKVEGTKHALDIFRNKPKKNKITDNQKICTTYLPFAAQLKTNNQKQ